MHGWDLTGALNSSDFFPAQARHEASVTEDEHTCGQNVTRRCARNFDKTSPKIRELPGKMGGSRFSQAIYITLYHFPGWLVQSAKIRSSGGW